MTERPTMLGLTIGNWVQIVLFGGGLVVVATTVQNDQQAMQLEIERINARIGVVENATDAQAVAAATSAAQMAAVRESLAELKSAQAETNRLLRDIISQEARP